MIDIISIKLHHRGYLNTEANYEYEGGMVDIIACIDHNNINYWELIDIRTKFGYN